MQISRGHGANASPLLQEILPIMSDFGPYSLSEKLGEGGFGEVYRARHRATGKEVALKILTRVTANARARFQREAQTARELNDCPHIVPVYDTGEVQGWLFIAMRFIDGDSLAQLIDLQRYPIWAQAMQYIDGIADALDYAHARKFIHRDVKPANILIDKDGHAWLTDFGLVKAQLAAGLTTHQGPIGTLPYMPPEVWLSRPVTPATDQYSLACVLVEALTGTSPFAARSFEGYMYNHLERPLTLPSQWPTGTPDDLPVVLRRALDREASARYPSVGEFARTLCALKPPAPRVSHPAVILRLPEVKPPRPEPAARYPHKPATPSVTLDLPGSVKLTVVRITGGEFRMGSHSTDQDARPNELPRHHLALDAYYIGRQPVTVAQFRQFVKDTGYASTADREGEATTLVDGGWRRLAGANWRHPFGPGSDVQGKDQHPVTTVSWLDAYAFCRWLRELTGRRVKLPTEAAWEKAARGYDGQIYPWGDAAPDRHCQYHAEDTAPVGQFSPRGNSPYGCQDMAGNVWEWTRYALRPYPYCNESANDEQRPRVLRGGCFASGHREVRCAARKADTIDAADSRYGFRVCVLSPQ
jgi:formylglycine-generating enzyme required for sulfatase activity/predicted Ser/Thr protein kinase